ncbi:MAG: 50S ribosomal protein L10 [Chitinispirillaceae bacterium]|nr:50S ribosomal protein L10 [Chitinispirillaceae bacterium]
MSTKAQRTGAIEKLEQEFKAAKGIYLTDNNKINVAQVTRLRADIRKKGMRFLVVKNSLAKIAAKRSGREAIESFFKGPTAVVIAKDDAVAPAKILKEFQKDNKDLLGVKTAYVDGSVFDALQVLKLADIPSREVLLAQLLGCLKAPMGNFAGVLGGILTKFVRTLDAVREKKVAAA